MRLLRDRIDVMIRKCLRHSAVRPWPVARALFLKAGRRIAVSREEQCDRRVRTAAWRLVWGTAPTDVGGGSFCLVKRVRARVDEPQFVKSCRMAPQDLECLHAGGAVAYRVSESWVRLAVEKEVPRDVLGTQCDIVRSKRS